MEIIGTIQKITTTADQSLRITIDVDKDKAPDNVFKCIYQEARITVVEND